MSAGKSAKAVGALEEPANFLIPSFRRLTVILQRRFWLVCSAVRVRGWQTVKSNELPAATMIVLQRGACEHRCAVLQGLYVR
jgi:hypothetical protein